MKSARLILSALCALCGFSATAAQPNILLILADDLGYGDVRCYNDQSKVATPHLDRLAREGMLFIDAPIRPYLLTQAFAGARTLSIRRGPWKYLDHPGSGGNRYDQGELKRFALPDAAPDERGQLYNLDTDPGEAKNLHNARPEIVKELKVFLVQSKASGRSRPANTP